MLHQTCGRGTTEDFRRTVTESVTDRQPDAAVEFGRISATLGTFTAPITVVLGGMRQRATVTWADADGAAGCPTLTFACVGAPEPAESAA